jgi:hypothetical protein
MALEFVLRDETENSFGVLWGYEYSNKNVCIQTINKTDRSKSGQHAKPTVIKPALLV